MRDARTVTSGAPRRVERHDGPAAAILRCYVRGRRGRAPRARRTTSLTRDSASTAGEAVSARRAIAVAIVMVAALSFAVSPGFAQITYRAERDFGSAAARRPSGAITRSCDSRIVCEQPGGVDVTFVVDGKSRVLKTDANGRAEVSGLAAGTRVVATATVGTETLKSQEITIATGGIRVVLVATDPNAVAREAEDQKLAAGPAVKGTIVIGPESRIVADFSDERLNVYYVVELLNTARSPVDIGGPVVFDLPQGARGASILEGSTKQAVVSGARITVTGPFASGSTNVHVGFSLPFSGSIAPIRQAFPVPAQGLTVIGLQSNGLDIRSPQFTSRQFATDQGRRVVAKSPASAKRVRRPGLPRAFSWLYRPLGSGVRCAGLWAAFPRRIMARYRHRGISISFRLRLTHPAAGALSRVSLGAGRDRFSFARPNGATKSALNVFRRSAGSGTVLGGGRGCWRRRLSAPRLIWGTIYSCMPSHRAREPAFFCVCAALPTRARDHGARARRPARYCDDQVGVSRGLRQRWRSTGAHINRGKCCSTSSLVR